MNPQKDELNPPYDPKPKTLAEAVAADEAEPKFDIDEMDRLYSEDGKTVNEAAL